MGTGCLSASASGTVSAQWGLRLWSGGHISMPQSARPTDPACSNQNAGSISPRTLALAGRT